jgi:NRAMP (natural resistance-associated macrophage protein)-like metal ion transporter
MPTPSVISDKDPRSDAVSHARDGRRPLWRALGPGLITGASDDDPSGIATHSLAGAQFGYALLWTIPVTYPLMVAIQEISARIGRVTGRGLAANLRDQYGAPVCAVIIGLLLIANVVNLGADISAMGAAVHLVLGVPAPVAALTLTTLSLALQIFVPYHDYVRVLRFLTLVLFSYVAVLFFVDVDWHHALRGLLVPHIALERDYMTMLCAVFGTTISPYLFFWQASEEAEEEEDDPDARPLRDAPERAADEFRRIDVDTAIGMAFSNGIALFIMLATAATLNANGIHHVDSAAQAAEALRPLAGERAFLLFAIGIVGTALLALPVLAGSLAYALGELGRQAVGLEKSTREAPVFYAVLAAATLAGLTLSVFELNPIRALFVAAVVNGLVSVPVMALMMLLSNNSTLMGGFALPRWLFILGWSATGAMLVMSAGLLL